MKINLFSVTFWFNIYNEHNILLKKLQEKLPEFSEYNILNYTDNLFAPVLSSVNNSKSANLLVSQINLQYNMNNVIFDNYSDFQEMSLKIFEIISSLGIQVLHTAIFINGEKIDESALSTITKNTISSKLNNNLLDMTLKLGKCYDEQFYKIVTILNKKQIKLPRLVDEFGRAVPIPLISWNGALVENELIDISYEINDKYLFDFTKNYRTTEFHLNKMLYILSESFFSDIDSILEKGEF